MAFLGKLGMARQLESVVGYLRRLVGAGPEGDATDSQLLRCYQASGDEQAFAALVRRHGPLVWSVCQRVLGDLHDAEDAFQATFLVFARKARSVYSGQALPSWLYGTAYRTACKARSRAAQRRSHERQATMPATETADPRVWEELRPILDEELNRLPQSYRQSVVLRYLQGKSCEETARALGCPVGTVTSRLSRALEMLRRRLKRRGLDASGAALAAVLSEKAVSAAPPALLEATIPAALLWAAGRSADAAGLSSQVITLAQGVLHTMFLSKLKSFSLLALAILLMAGSGFLFHRGVLAEDDALAVPLRRDPLQDVKEAKPSEAVVKDGLSLTVKPTKSIFSKDETPTFEVAFGNVSEKALKLYAFNWWPEQLQHVDVERWTGDKPWKSRATRIVFPRTAWPAPVSLELRPGETCGRGFNLDQKSWRWERAGEKLLPGKYRLCVTVKLSSPVAGECWKGEMTSKAADFEIADQVQALKLTLSADKTQTVMKADGSNAEPVQLKLTFTNVSDKPIKLDNFDLGFSHCQLVDLLGPDGPVKPASSSQGYRGIIRTPAGTRLPVIKPGESWSQIEDGNAQRRPDGSWKLSDKPILFPGSLCFHDGSIASYELKKPGQYRFKWKYVNDERNNAGETGAWTGELTSNELVLKVLPADGKAASGP